VHGIKLARLPAAIPKAGQNLERVAQHDVDLLIRAICQEDILLLRIFGESDVPDRAIAARILGDEHLLDKRAIRFENLNAVVRPIADIQQVVVGKFGAVNWIAELLRGRIFGLGWPEVGVVGLVPVGAPVPFVFTGLGVEYDDAVIAVAIGDV
jgi:hypothetical protein